MEGWIKLWRQFALWQWYSDLYVKSVFIHLLISANHKDGYWRGMLIRKGQMVTSLEHLANELRLSVQQIRTALNKLKATNEITINATNKYSIITICKYESYQADTIGEQQAEQQTINKQITNNQQTNNKQSTTNKNNKNKENDKKEYINIPQSENLFTQQGEIIADDIVNLEEEKEKSCAKKEKEPKHKYGEYQKVLLTDTEAKKLHDKYGDDAVEIVNFFDAEKEMKGYTYKNDYLAILKWGAEAYYKKSKNQSYGNKDNEIDMRRIFEAGQARNAYEQQLLGNL